MSAFARDHLFISIYEACKHRPTSIADADALTQTIIAKLRPHIADGAITKHAVVATAQAVLQNFDTAAATMYAAYHAIVPKEQ